MSGRDKIEEWKITSEEEQKRRLRLETLATFEEGQRHLSDALKLVILARQDYHFVGVGGRVITCAYCIYNIGNDFSELRRLDAQPNPFLAEPRWLWEEYEEEEQEGMYTERDICMELDITDDYWNRVVSRQLSHEAPWLALKLKKDERLWRRWGPVIYTWPTEER